VIKSVFVSVRNYVAELSKFGGRPFSHTVVWLKIAVALTPGSLFDSGIAMPLEPVFVQGLVAYL
jgi:hypothetical protein